MRKKATKLSAIAAALALIISMTAACFLSCGPSAVEGKLATTDPALVPKSFFSDDVPFRKVTTEGEDKVLSTYVSFVEIKDIHYIHLKLELCWKTPPRIRLFDIIAIDYLSSLIVPAQKNNKLDGVMHVKSICHTADNTLEVDNAYAGKELNACRYNNGKKDSLAFMAELPKDSDLNIYTDIVVSLELTFYTLSSDITGTEMKPQYSHQISNDLFEREIWNFLSITLSDSWLLDQPQ